MCARNKGNETWTVCVAGLVLLGACSQGGNTPAPGGRPGAADGSVESADAVPGADL